MITVIVLFRNAPHHAARCLQSLSQCLSGLLPAEFVLVDDASDTERGIMPLLRDFRDDAAARGAAARIIHFHRQMHYGHGLAYALSAARGEHVLFVSHDMVLTRDCVEEMLAVSATDERIGILRPTSPHMDWAKKFVQSPHGDEETKHFSAAIRGELRGQVVDWPMLIGDAMLIKRAVIDRIGVFDTRFYGFMSDIDYGVRARRAGFRHVIARGAWLHHEGNGTAKEQGSDVAEQGRAMLELVETAYAQFRRKWGEENLPPHFRDMRREHFECLHALPPLAEGEYEPPLELTADVGTCEVSA